MNSGQPANKSLLGTFWKHLSLTRLYFGLMLALGSRRFEIELTSAHVTIALRAGKPRKLLTRGSTLSLLFSFHAKC